MYEISYAHASHNLLFFLSFFFLKGYIALPTCFLGKFVDRVVKTEEKCRFCSFIEENERNAVKLPIFCLHRTCGATLPSNLP